MTQDCALCRCAFEPKEQSHIVSAFVYRWLKSTSVTGFMRFGRSINVRSQDGIKDYFLCGACEDRLSTWESVFAKEIFYPFAANDSVCVNYGEDILKFVVSASWRVLAYEKQKGRLNHFRGRHECAVNSALETWSSYLLGTVDDIGKHEIHLLPFSGVADYSGEYIPPNFNRYLRRAVEIDTVVSDDEAITYCKLGPLILIGLIQYPDPNHWENTKVRKFGRFGPCNTACPAQYRDYMFKRSARLQQLQEGLSEKQRAVIKRSYEKNSAKLKTSETIRASIADLELGFRRGEFDTEGDAKRD